MNNQGFSIVELSIALTIAAIICGSFIAATRLGELNELKQFINSTGRLIRDTATIASSSGALCQITFSNNEKELVAKCQNSPSAPRKITYPNRIRSVTAMFGGTDSNQITTYQNGVFSPGSLIVEQGSHSCLLTLSLYGSQKVNCL